MNLFDTCAIIYALDKSSPFHAWAVQAIIDASQASQAFVNPIVVAELASGAAEPDMVLSELSKFGIQTSDLPISSAILAGKAYAVFLRIPINSDTCSNPFRTVFRDIRTVVGA